MRSRFSNMATIAGHGADIISMCAVICISYICAVFVKACSLTNTHFTFCVPAYLCWAVALPYFTTQLFEIVHACGTHDKLNKKCTGKMQCITSMAMLQNVHRRMPGCQFPSEVNVHSPAQVLPKTNWSTIQGRMQRWMVWGGCGVGKCRDNVAQDVSNALSTVSWSPRARMTGTVRSSSP